jgi:large repetitive protein
VGNDGPSVARSVVVTDPVPAQLTVTGVTAPAPWVCVTGAPDASGTLVTCTLASLDPGADPGAIDVAVTATVAAYPAVSNTATVDSPTSDPVSSTATSTIPPVSDLAITKKLVGILIAGSGAEYRITVTNNGLTEDPGPITVTDPLPAGLTGTGARVVSGGGSCTVTSARVECTIPSLAVGASAVISVDVAVSTSARGTIVNTATALSADHPTAVSASASGVVDPSILPITGGPAGQWLPLAIALILAGLVLLWVVRRRRPGSAD